jgi:glycosyltransferase involved in cell wall biosynthesis
MPRVSVMMPAYNAAGTLRLAVASVLAQTFDDWECIVVDDGSHDATHEIAQSVRDERFKVIRLLGNRGRPFARGTALEASTGQYLCMLDADDWMYPERLAAQVQVLDTRPDVAIVSAGMAIVSATGELVGARGFGQGKTLGLSQPVRPPNLPPIAHAPSMLRRSHVGIIRYDPRLKLSQDADFLLRVLTGKRYYLMPDLLYAYTELSSVTLSKLLRAHHYTRLIQRKYLADYGVRAGLNIVDSYVKSAAYAALFAVGLGTRTIAARSTRPSAEHARAFELAKREVHDFARRTFQ